MLFELKTSINVKRIQVMQRPLLVWNTTPTQLLEHVIEKDFFAIAKITKTPWFSYIWY